MANYGSGTISEIDLIAMTQSRVASIGSQPAALAMDPSGTALWMGGEGYLAKVDLTTLTVISSIPVNGAVTSVAISDQQGTILYTVVSNPMACPSGQAAAPQSTFSVRETRLSDGVLVGTYASMSAERFQTCPGEGSMPTLLLAKGALVSANYANGLAVAGTPTGFVVINVVDHEEFMRGDTPSPVRAIAVNPGQGIVYLTAPDSNALITVPLPRAL